jgi:drug/metabolite transporter (DMT)-like permease
LSNSWIYLVLIAQSAWAISIYLDKHLVTHNGQGTGEHAVGTLVLFSAFFCAVVAVGVFFFVWLQSDLSMIWDQSLPNIARALCVGALDVVWLIPYFYALHHTDETAAPPLFQTVPLFGALLGYYFFGEVLTVLQLVAGGVIMAGSLVLNLQSLHHRSHSEIRSLFNWRAVGLMLVSSFIIAFSAFVFKEAAVQENYAGATFWMLVGAVVMGGVLWCVIPAYRREFNLFVVSSDRKKIFLNSVNELSDNLANIAFYWAVVVGPSTAVVQATVAYQPILILIIGAILARMGSKTHAEKLQGSGLWVRVLGITLIAGGSILLIS